MNWIRRVNTTFGKMTGFQLTRLPVAAPETEADVRPPADPAADRLLREPVFLLCPVRSGSTLLRAVLNAHSKIHAPHELHVRRLTVGYGTPLAERAMDALGHNRADLEHLLWDRVLHRELDRSGKQIIVDKTPSNAFVFRRIATCWPDARYVFLLRHPASIARSWQESTGRSADDAVTDSLRYMKAVDRARKALPGLTVRYEDFTADPAGKAGEICSFLGVDFEPRMLEYGDAPWVKGLGDWRDKIRTGTVQRGRPLPAAEEVPAPLRELTGRWGYP
ncbi:sulfotransferase [Nonomuraea sp. NPDC049152]|uniref:sulfotransferase family protein n=1 Tax=Nonomuraea sp. NPDC049152 TaxID=3154350 RepID=UPI0033C990B3